MAKIADLHRKRGDMEAAYECNKRNMARLDDASGEGGAPAHGADVVATLMFLTQHCKGTHRLDEAERYCARLLDYGGNHREDAKSLLKEIRLLKMHRQGEREGEGGGAGQAGSGDDDDGSMSMSDDID